MEAYWCCPVEIERPITSLLEPCAAGRRCRPCKTGFAAKLVTVDLPPASPGLSVINDIQVGNGEWFPWTSNEIETFGS